MYNNSRDNHLIMYSWRPERRAAIEKWYYITTLLQWSCNDGFQKPALHWNGQSEEKNEKNVQRQRYSLNVCVFFNCECWKMVCIPVVHWKVRKSWNLCTRHNNQLKLWKVFLVWIFRWICCRSRLYAFDTQVFPSRLPLSCLFRSKTIIHMVFHISVTQNLIQIAIHHVPSQRI